MPPPPEGAKGWASRVVLGTWGLSGSMRTDSGPAGYGHVADETVMAVLDAAYSQGVRWLDGATGYGGGRGLGLVDQWQQQRGLLWQVVVKAGRPVDAHGPRGNLDLSAIREELTAQPIVPAAVLVKDPAEEALRRGAVHALISQLSEDGHPTVGVATHRLDLVPALGPPPVAEAVLQLEYNLLNRITAVPAARTAAALGWRVWGMQPLAYGFLGSHGQSAAFARDDWRSRIPEPVRHTFQAGVAGLPGWLPEPAAVHPLAEAALAWSLASPALERVVVGPRSCEQLRSLDGAWELASDPEFQAFAGAFDDSGRTNLHPVRQTSPIP